MHKKLFFFFLLMVKGIVSDSNNIFLWHESEEINKTSSFPKFQLIPISRFQVMHDYACFIAPIDYCVDRLSVKIALMSYWSDFSLIPFGGIVLLRGELWKYAKNSNFEIFWKRTLFNISEYAFNVSSCMTWSQISLRFNCQSVKKLISGQN